MVEDARRQLEEERKAHSGTLVEHKDRLLEHERGTGILQGKLQVLTSETEHLRQQLQDLEQKARESEVRLAQQAQDNDERRAAVAKARAETEEVEAQASEKLRTSAKDCEAWMEDELEKEDRRSKPRCGCSIQ